MAACQDRHGLHIFFLPFLAPGHMVPMVDMARSFTEHGAKSTIVTTPLNVARIRPSIDHFNNSSENQYRTIQILQIQFPSSYSEPGENVSSFQSPSITDELLAAMNSLRKPFEELVEKHRPDAIVSDVFYIWSPDSADLFGIPRLGFHGSGTFPVMVSTELLIHRPHDGVVSDEKKFVVPGLHHRVEMRMSEIPSYVLNPSFCTDDMARSSRRSYGVVMNTFRELEKEYIRDDGKTTSPSSWEVGPLSLSNRNKEDMIVRGDVIVDGFSATCLDWLDSMKPRSVLYVCFGSCGRFTVPQLKEIASGLDASGDPFIWVVKSVGGIETSEWLPEVERRSEKGVILTGWAPQVLILNHKSIGGFMSHCGWNSCLESITAGVPMVTWPLFGDQFFNMKFIVDVVKVGVEVGDMVCSDIAEERRVVTWREIEKAVGRVMGGGDEAVEMRKRVSALRSMGLKAVEEGGSSYNNVNSLINELMKLKQDKTRQGGEISIME